MYLQRKTMEHLLWILLPLLVAAGSAMLSFLIMQARLEVAVAKERTALAEANTLIRSHQHVLEASVQSAEQACYRKAFDQFLTEFRVEERHYMRETRTAQSTRKSMILQERLFFREIPLSNWVEHELPLEENSDPAALARGASTFQTPSLQGLGHDAQPAALAATGV